MSIIIANIIGLIVGLYAGYVLAGIYLRKKYPDAMVIKAVKRPSVQGADNPIEEELIKRAFETGKPWMWDSEHGYRSGED